MGELTHFDKNGNATMVDVSEKKETERQATACSVIVVGKETLQRIKEGSVKKGDVLSAATVAGIMGAKQTSNLIPMCHPLMITGCKIEFEIDEENSAIKIFATVKITGKTGVEMEALTAASITELTIYDMCKAIDKRMVIQNTFLLNKSGGKSGDFNFYE